MANNNISGRFGAISEWRLALSAARLSKAQGFLLSSRGSAGNHHGRGGLGLSDKMVLPVR